jgi:tRNA U38,U39,U40 pseudouridine synthase TruA
MKQLEKRFDEERNRNNNEARDIQKIQIEAQKLGVALWGIDGNNGMRSQVRDVIGKVEEIQKDINTISVNHKHIMDSIHQINKKLDREDYK